MQNSMQRTEERKAEPEGVNIQHRSKSFTVNDLYIVLDGTNLAHWMLHDEQYLTL